MAFRVNNKHPDGRKIKAAIGGCELADRYITENNLEVEGFLAHFDSGIEQVPFLLLLRRI